MVPKKREIGIRCSMQQNIAVKTPNQSFQLSPVKNI